MPDQNATCGAPVLEGAKSCDMVPGHDGAHGFTLPLAAVLVSLERSIVADGGYFRKCANCGSKYPLPQADWTNETVCGELCHAAYVAYLNSPEGRGL